MKLIEIVFVFLFLFLPPVLLSESLLPKHWIDWHEVELQSQWLHFVQEKVPPLPQSTFHSQGIVIAAGGVKHLTNAWLSVQALRRTGCQLPVEIWYSGSNEISNDWINAFQKLNCKCNDVLTYVKNDPNFRRFFENNDVRINGFSIKPFAILYSHFDEVLLLDADNYPLQDVTELFTNITTVNVGALFWPDFWFLDKSHKAFSHFLINTSENEMSVLHSQEAGQLLVKKSFPGVWIALNLICFLASDGREKFYFNESKMVYGDKDLYQIIFIALHVPYTMIPHMPGLVGIPVETRIDSAHGVLVSPEDFGFCGKAMVHFNLDGNAFFLHATMSERDSTPKYDERWIVGQKMKSEILEKLHYNHKSQFLALRKKENENSIFNRFMKLGRAEGNLYCLQYMDNISTILKQNEEHTCDEIEEKGISTENTKHFNILEISKFEKKLIFDLQKLHKKSFYKLFISDSQDYKVHLELGIINVNRNRRNEALISLRQAIQLMPTDSQVLLTMGFALAMQNSKHSDKLEACTFLQKAIDSKLNKAKLLQRNSISTNSIGMMNRVKKLNDDAALALNKLGFLKYEFEKYKEATSIFQKATTIQPLRFDNWSALGVLYQLLNRYTESEFAYENAIRLEPTNAHVAYNAGKLTI
eukprot:g4193.t1